MIAVCVDVANADVLPILVKCERIFQQLCLASDIKHCLRGATRSLSVRITNYVMKIFASRWGQRMKLTWGQVYCQ